jgi:integrase
MAIQKLSDAKVRNAKPKAKDQKLADGGGLSLLVKANGTKCWRYSYRFAGKQKTLALGVYPEISLKEAREAHSDARKLLTNNVDPAAIKKREKQQAAKVGRNQFSVVAKEWWVHQKGAWTEGHADRVWRRLEVNALVDLGDRSITDILPQDIIQVIRNIEERGTLDVAGRVLQDLRRICTYAVISGLINHNPAVDLTGVLKARKTSHRASLPREEMPGFLKDLGQYERIGRLLTKYAVELLLLTFVRPGELRGARWNEFNVEERLWRIPAERMKMKTEHLVPLSVQALGVIEKIREISGQYDLLFPSERRRDEPMSDNTMRKAIFTMGYDGNTEGKSKAVPHGFRATASSILNEEGFNPDAIERQLSHMERNGVRAAYTHHARYLDDRRQIMQWWADYLDDTKKS